MNRKVLTLIPRDEAIDVSKLKRAQPTRVLDPNMIEPAKEKVEDDIYEEHSAEPIKNIEDIYKLSDYFLSREKYRDYMLLIVGINFGLRASDLRMLRFTNLINDNLTFKDRFPVFERKTRNTRKRKKNRYITINDAVIEAVTLYLKHTEDVSLSDFLFMSESPNKGQGEPMNVRSISRILKQAAADVGLNIRVSSHTLRKTFCYHQMLMSNNDNRKLLLLQKMLGHSTPAQTLDYIGITSEEIDEAYRTLNLGQSKKLMDSVIEETDVAV